MSVNRAVPGQARDTKIGRRLRPARLHRALRTLAVTGATAGASLLLAASAAQAVTGTEPGNLHFSPASGAATLAPTWSTTDACPTGYQGSAVLYALNKNGSIGTSASSTVANVTSAFSGTLLGPIGKIISLGTDVPKGGTSEWVVACSAGVGGTGATKYVQTISVTLSATGSSYASAAGPPGSGKTASTLWSSAWFDIALAIVVIGLVLAIAGVYLRKTVRVRRIASPHNQ